MDGGGWAGVQTWVRAAEAETNDLQVVSAEDARPGDIVVYDWGGQEDFGADGHIGFLASNVEGGKFTALEGNNQDAVMSVPRSTSQANVKFIRIGGTGSAAAGRARRRGAARRRARRAGRGRDVRRRQPPAPPAAVEPSGGGRGRRRGRGHRRERRRTRTPATTRRRSRSPPGWPRRPRSAGSRRSCRSMASLVESGMTNIQGGDADSVGFFQMRVGIWNQGDYAGYPDKPELQVKWFLDQAEAGQEGPRRRRQADRRPQLLRRMDRRRRTPRRAIPRPLPTQARRSQRPPRQRRLRPARRRAAGRQRRAGRRGRRGGRRRRPSSTAGTRCSSWPPRARRRRRRRTSTARPCSS